MRPGQRATTLAYRHTLELIYKDQSKSDRIAAFRFLA